MRKTAAVFTVLAAILLLTAIPAVGAKPITVTSTNTWTQIQTWGDGTHKGGPWSYTDTLVLKYAGKAMHFRFGYSPDIVQPLTHAGGTHEVIAHAGFDGEKYVLTPLLVHYVSPYSGYWITEIWVGDFTVDGSGVITSGHLLQECYAVGYDPTGHYTHASQVGPNRWLIAIHDYVLS